MRGELDVRRVWKARGTLELCARRCSSSSVIAHVGLGPRLISVGSLVTAPADSNAEPGVVVTFTYRIGIEGFG
jgi:hypothetical protein